MDKIKFTFELTTKLSKIFDKNYFYKVKDFNDNLNINFILSNRIKNMNHLWNRKMNLYFNEHNIKNPSIDNEKIFFTDKGYMINLYFIDQEFYKSKKEYMDYNMGVILNNILSIFDMKYNFTGMHYVYSKHKIYNELFVSKSIEKIFELLRLDYNKYKIGFKSEDEMFEWLIKTPYLNTNKIINNNKIKNKTFIQFKEYINKHKIGLNADFSESVLYDIIMQHFPDIDFNLFIRKQNKQLAENFH